MTLPERWTHHISRLLAGGTVVPMVLSVYLLQTTVDDNWRNLRVIFHVSSSILWLTMDNSIVEMRLTKEENT